MSPLILDNYYMEAVCRLTGELGEDMEPHGTAFTKNFVLPPQIITARAIPDSLAELSLPSDNT